MKNKLKDVIINTWDVFFSVIFNIYAFFENIIFFFKRLYYWVPILWSDRDWDYGYLLKIMKHKLSEMEQHFKKNNYTYDSKRTAKQIKYAIFLINVAQNGDNHPKIKKMIENNTKKYGEEKTLKEGQIHFLKESIWRAFPFPEKITTKKMFDEYRQDLLEYFKASNAIETDAKKRLFRHMEQYLTKWWD